ncbi:2-dehydro-3-deoxy-6-phosphogalactonate aldolase [Aestuariivirga litoralis]|uniref:2-dehydro-3-deoxy-6-phosphogalactonate aldolase n=1 Tax=Aestuariivirga litoralis TaxID=2650924 RepID=UPI0018C47971|nr:2-dehydro-3-deoxy-6-phosphogalactonate aldolase [Aestuariivirga litoralis]MBG1233608.1 2-dehydro-3-deoxy-6-phosphogalactonate aldolase [Aestuariivirga litoralis]
MKLNDALDACGIIAILRGVTPAEVLDVGTTLYEAGIRIVEVPLNSPEPFVSIEKLAKAFAGKMVVGAGTVLTESDVEKLKASGGTISVSPDCNPATIARAVALGLNPLPGVFTPTEAFAAIRAGASQLKLFPAEVASPQTIKAWKAVLPKHVKVHAVGGVTPANMADWIKAGASGFGIGSSLYKPRATLEHVAKSAGELVAAWQKAKV